MRRDSKVRKGTAAQPSSPRGAPRRANATVTARARASPAPRAVPLNKTGMAEQAQVLYVSNHGEVVEVVVVPVLTPSLCFLVGFRSNEAYFKVNFILSQA